MWGYFGGEESKQKSIGNWVALGFYMVLQYLLAF